MINFKVIDGDYDNYDIIDEFIELYYNYEYSVPMICEHFNMSYGRYNRIRKYCIEKGLIDGEKSKYTNRLRFSRYIRKRGNKYWVRKTINHKNRGFGTYVSFNIAKKIVIELIKVDWDIDELPRIRKQVLT